MKDFINFEDLDDRRALLEFLEWTSSFLEELVNQASSDQEALFFDELKSPMKNAWETIYPRFRDLQGSVSNIQEGTLIEHGLVGQELRFKLSTIRIWFRKYSNNNTGPDLRRLLKALKTIVGSILSATPLGTAISEFIDAISDSVMD